MSFQLGVCFWLLKQYKARIVCCAMDCNNFSVYSVLVQAMRVVILSTLTSMMYGIEGRCVCDVPFDMLSEQ